MSTGLTKDTLAEYVGAVEGVDEDFVKACANQATALVDGFVGDATVPSSVLELAYLNVGSELYARRGAPSGIAQFAVPEAESPARLARDPLTSVYPLLKRYTGQGVA